MSEFMQLDAEAPATLGAVVEAVTRLSTLSEAKILELVSAGKIAELFPFKPYRRPADPVRYAEGGRARGGLRITLESEAARRADPIEFTGDLAEETPAAGGFKALARRFTAAAFDSLRRHSCTSRSNQPTDRSLDLIL